MDNDKRWVIGILIFLGFLFLASISKIAEFFTDFWWFKNLGFEKIFIISLKAKITMFVVSALIFIVFAVINIKIASLKSKRNIPFKPLLLITMILALFFGSIVTYKWFEALQFFNHVKFGLADPIFLKDVSFYVFALPFINIIWRFAMGVLIVTTLILVIEYAFPLLKSVIKPTQILGADGSVQVPKITFPEGLKRKAMVHGAVFGSFFFILLSVQHYLSRFSIMYSEKGIVVGAGYTDVIAYLPMIKLLMVLAIISAIALYVWIFYISKQKQLRKRHILAYILAVYLIFFFIGPTIIPGLIQNFKVSPNEINLEKPYIENNINFTRIAYGLDNVEEEDFSVKMSLTPEVLANEPETMNNIRLLDWRPLTQTYKQTQEIRLYYDLSGIDVDRYTIDGKYTQVMISPREMNQDKIAENAKTWVNLRFVYTHGFGAVVSPVNKVTREGLPDYLVKDIPPASDSEVLEIEKPQVYYGEKTGSYVIANTKTEEFDFPQGNSNQYINYDGVGGVKIDSFFKKVMMAIRLKDFRILLSSDITDESRVLFNRQIADRVSRITPFLSLDNDPYIVIDDGNLYWILDAYTTTGNFPYSEKIGSINYLRNSVKIVVNAYDGDVSYYVVDPEDPLISTYAKIFPKQFKSYNLIPEGLKKHTRYPIDLFKVQSSIYSTYHMDDATVFYNKEDAWQIPNEIYGTGQQVKVEPYYIIMKLPGESKEEYVLMTTFNPIRKDNMVAWLAARSDNANYGKLLLYKFPKEKLVFGPLQIEAKFDQDSEISQQLTLWSQQCSRVTRGNLLAIPIRDSILYIEPLYMQAEQGQLPEMKRVLVSDGERVVMEKDLKTALEALFGKAKTTSVEFSDEDTQESLIEDANKYYESLLESMGNDWVAFGQNFDNLGVVLNKLKE